MPGISTPPKPKPLYPLYRAGQGVGTPVTTRQGKRLPGLPLIRPPVRVAGVPVPTPTRGPLIGSRPLDPSLDNRVNRAIGQAAQPMVNTIKNSGFYQALQKLFEILNGK